LAEVDAAIADCKWQLTRLLRVRRLIEQEFPRAACSVALLNDWKQPGLSNCFDTAPADTSTILLPCLDAQLSLLLGPSAAVKSDYRSIISIKPNQLNSILTRAQINQIKYKKSIFANI
jgi:hypothetical protein